MQDNEYLKEHLEEDLRERKKLRNAIITSSLLIAGSIYLYYSSISDLSGRK